MYRGTDNLNQFFSIGSMTTATASPSSLQFAKDAKAAKDAQTEVMTSAFSGTMQTAQYPVQVSSTQTTEPTEPVFDSPEVFETKPLIIGGGGGTYTTAPMEVKTQAPTETPSKFKMTTKHWIIFLIVAVSLYAAYKHFTKKKP